MPRIAKEMTALAVKKLKYPADKADTPNPAPVFQAVGGVQGLYIQLTHGGGKSWIYRYSVTVDGKQKRRSMGLGSFSNVSLSEARDKARAAAAQREDNADPIRERTKERAKATAQAAIPTFGQVIDLWGKDNPHEFGSAGHRARWLSSVRALDTIANIRIDELNREDIWEALAPVVERGAVDTANRIRQRVATLWDWADDEFNLVTEDEEGNAMRFAANPATGWLTRKLSKRLKGVKKGHQPALQVEDAPRWFSALRILDGIGSRAFELLALTAARSGEVRGARWDEVDLGRRVWSIPAERMKMDRPHEVPLSPAAVDLLEGLPRLGELIFPAPHGGMLSDGVFGRNGTMGRIHQTDVETGGAGFLDKDSGKPAVPHGLRTTFRVWAGRNGFDREDAERALAHQVGSAVEQAYARDTFVERRRALLVAWSEYLGGVQ